MYKAGDVVKSTVIADCDGNHPDLEVVSVSEPGATGWVGLTPDEDRLVTVKEPIRGEFELFIDTIY